MDGTSGSAAGGPGKRGSFLPRPGLSKLPTPGSAIGTNVTSPTTSSNMHSSTSLKSPSMSNSNVGLPRQEPSKPSTAPIPRQRPLSTFGAPPTTLSRPKSTSQSNNGIAHRPNLSPNKAPSSSNNHSVACPPARSSQAQHQRQTSIASSTSSTRSTRLTRQNSMQSESPQESHSSEESEPITSTPTSPVANGSSLKIPKKPRQSLSDRTIETLANVPPSPAGERRRSSVFSPQSPITPQQRPQRPSSVIGHPNTASKINYGSATGSVAGRNVGSFARPASPVKNRPPSSLNPAGMPKRSFSTSFTRPSAPTSSTPRAMSPTKMNRFATVSGKIATPRPGLGIVTESGKPTQNKLSKTKAVVKTETRAMGPHNEQSDGVQDGNKNPATSSAALRQKIAEAKAAARNLQRKQQESVDDAKPTSYDFGNCQDPFNTTSKDGKDTLRARVDDARRDGRLNISALSLPEIPPEVLSMYDAAAMEDSSVAWNETVDLVRFNAADNNIANLSDQVFPDISSADLADTEDTRGNQFGGLEHLDFHGNKLQSMPIGLRQLTRLTSLNLSRNKLDVALLDIITRIPTLCDLNLSNNELTHELPESIGRLSLLETMDLSHNRISSLPPSLRDLSRLRSLNVSHNRIQNIPFEALKNIATFRDLTASHNAFSGALFPSSVTCMPKLRNLDVSDNAVASLNFAKVLKLPALVRMDISRNRLGIFPDISEWKNLAMLIANENALSDLPRGIVNLKEKLRTVSLERNSIRDVDECIADMEGLEVLNVSGNPLRERRLLGMDTAEVKREMHRRRELAGEFAEN